jgi:hypothetical protein
VDGCKNQLKEVSDIEPSGKEKAARIPESLKRQSKLQTAYSGAHQMLQITDTRIVRCAGSIMLLSGLPVVAEQNPVTSLSEPDVLLCHIDFEDIPGIRAIEVRPSRMDPGVTAQQFASAHRQAMRIG